jgi:kynurenine formamidase
MPADKFDPGEPSRWMETLSNWGRWGPDDELGTINLITPEKRLRAVRLASEGTTISCAQPITYASTPDQPSPTRRFMLSSAEAHAHADTPMGMAMDAFLIAPHGFAITHLDALAHFFWQGQMYNGRPAHAVSAERGATFAAVDVAASGVMSRGVLLDIPALKEVEWLAPGTPVHARDLEAAEERQGVKVETGDILFVRTGHPRYRRVKGPADAEDEIPGWTARYPGMLKRPGLHPDCLPFLYERGVAVLGCDTATDVSPPDPEAAGVSIHTVGIVAMGLWLIDNCDHEELAAACQRLRRWEFLATVSPLKLQNATGCPVNPLVLL